MSDTKVKMFYFGPWDSAGHYVHDETGRSPRFENRATPWSLGELDGGLQPHNCREYKRGEQCSGGSCSPQGLASVHHKGGWTALAFWDSSVDTRSGSCSVYIAEGTFNFDEMVVMSKERFAYRWNKMNFPVMAASASEEKP